MISEEALDNPDLATNPVGSWAWEIESFRPSEQVVYTRRTDEGGIWDQDAGKVKKVEIAVRTTDAAYYWEKEWGDPLREPKRYEQNSPHRYADAIRTPMLVIHGDKDYRVPIGEALRLWYDLQKRGVPSKFLYFPDENHWVLNPGNARVWYETVLAFLAEHVLEQPWQRPELI